MPAAFKSKWWRDRPKSGSPAEGRAGYSDNLGFPECLIVAAFQLVRADGVQKDLGRAVEESKQFVWEDRS